MSTPDDGAIARLRVAAMWPAFGDGRYVVDRLIARGGMGTVYAALDTTLDREVAIKVSNAVPGRPAASALDARLTTEAHILARLEHPGIVPVHDAGVLADGRPFYVMKFIHGRTLAEARDGLAGLGARLAVIERLVDTVAFAHAAGVVHRDLKPSNVMIGGFGEVLVLDWGVARVSGAGPEEAGVRVGTHGYMPPEQREGRETGPAADVYALGTLLDWITDGFDTSKRLRAIVQRCRADDPRDRYPDASSLANDLARLRAGAPVTAYRDTVWDRVTAWIRRYAGFIALVAAYLVMRTLLALWMGR